MSRRQPGESDDAGTMPGSRVRGRPHMTWMGDAKAYTGLSVGEVVRKFAEQNTWKTFA